MVHHDVTEEQIAANGFASDAGYIEQERCGILPIRNNDLSVKRASARGASSR